jgi:hypothetical protein
MPRVTTPIQRVRPANAQKSPAATQVRAANFQPQRAAPRATVSGATGTYVGARPTNTLSSAAPAAVSPATCNCSACTSLQCLERTRFFAGQLLTDTDLTNEQNYVLAKNRLHNRYLHGWGVVCGLQLTCSECDGWVTVNPGYAIDPCGNDIIVCAAQSFNVLDAIQACSNPSSTVSDCSPLRYRPAPSCTDAIQKWCVTVQYQEQATQMVTPLTQTSSSSSGCGCGCGGSTGNGCSCGCSGATKKSSGCGCGAQSSSSSSSYSSSTSAACEPTRIIEGFQFGVCALPADSTAAQPGTLLYQAENCVKTTLQLAEQAPVLGAAGTPTGTPQQWYQSVTNYLYTVQQYFAQNQVLTYCKALSALNNIVIPQPTTNSVLSDYQDVEGEIVLVLVVAIFDCVCVALLPQCPPNPCDTRVPLACVSVQNGAVISICHFECRQQLIGFPSLQYWLQPLFASVGTLITSALEKFCCPSIGQKSGSGYLNTQNAYSSANFTTAGFTNSATFNRTISSYVAQKMGASLVNTVNPNLNAMDTRPYVGQPVEALQAALYNKAKVAQGSAGDKSTDTGAATNNPYQTTQLDIQPVDDDPSWDLAAIASSAQLAPSAVSAGQPLTVYVSGANQSIVGIEVTDPTRALQLQINNLSQQVTTLQNQLTGAQATSPEAKASGKTSKAK